MPCARVIRLHCLRRSAHGIATHRIYQHESAQTPLYRVAFLFVLYCNVPCWVRTSISSTHTSTFCRCETQNRCSYCSYDCIAVWTLRVCARAECTGPPVSCRETHCVIPDGTPSILVRLRSLSFCLLCVCRYRQILLTLWFLCANVIFFFFFFGLLSALCSLFICHRSCVCVWASQFVFFSALGSSLLDSLHFIYIHTIRMNLVRVNNIIRSNNKSSGVQGSGKKLMFEEGKWLVKCNNVRVRIRFSVWFEAAHTPYATVDGHIRVRACACACMCVYWRCLFI